MSFYEAVTAPTVAAVIHDHLDLLPLVLSHRLVRRDVAVTPTFFLAAPRGTCGVVGTLFAREAVYDTRNLSHVFPLLHMYVYETFNYYPKIKKKYSKISTVVSLTSRTASCCAMR